MKPRVEIRYCSLCRWLLRSGWLAQEILSTFADEVGEVALIPGDQGQFQILVDGELIWCRVADHGFPEAKEIKQRIRDKIAPERDLGHSDRHH
ncbi:SelT/selW/selH domain-containing protein [Oceanimonas sp. GK1]|uniref:SelT/SelW/SelH family protein n=1 Tax=Oceanimonas sp. (strain GK1 / IBRC-M 10197) TaxID=511062 RepID=UPI00024953AF|nr:SelT/SelW/SelH family protein [Oceanimonas sp. GK1]AEY01957.1 SelT/selW/selH domain-containing protein [Oceanimonas sp. GK1]